MTGGRVVTLADILNSPTEITHKGVTYQLREPTLMERGQFQRWLESNARAAAGRATELTPDEQRQLIRDVNTDIAVGTFAFGGAACVAALQTPDGIAKMYGLVLGVSAELAAEIVGAQQAECVAALLGAMDGGTEEEGKGIRQALVSLGLPSDFLSPSSSFSSRTRPSTTAWITSEACPPAS